MRNSPTTGATVRHANAVAVLTALRDAHAHGHGPLTVTELAARTGLSRPTVDAVVAELGRTSPVRVGAPSAGGRGRPARSVSFAADAGCVAGVDAGSHTVRIVLTDLAGGVLTQTTTPVPSRLAEGERQEAVREQVRAAVRSVGLPLNRLRAVGLAVPGALDREDRLAASEIAPEWVGVPLSQQLRRSWRCPVALENDIKLAALAEHKIGAAQADQISYWQLGHRVSLASIIDGAILQGHHRLAGELTTHRGLRWTSSSDRGTLRWLSRPTAEAVFAAAAAGEAGARAEVETFCAEIAPVIATVTLTTDPEVLVVGGGLSLAGSTLLEPLRREVHALLAAAAKPRVVASHLSTAAAVCGALGLAFTRWSSEIVGVDAVVAPWPAWQPDALTTCT